MDMYFSSGQVAEDLDTTQETIRRHCQTGGIKAELTQGGQYRIPQSERDRLLRDGLPAMPRPLPGDKGRPTISRSGTPPPGLLAQPSDSLVESAEGVAKLAYEVKTLRLQRRRDAEVDHIRKRESRIVEEQREQVEAAQARQAAHDAERARAAWLQRWEEYALRSLPYNATPQTRLDVHQQVRAQLSGLNPLPTDVTVQSLIQAIVARAMSIAKCRQASHDIVERLMRGLPYGIQHGADFAVEKGAALTLMMQAVDQLPVDSGEELKEAAAKLAVEPILKRYHQYQACQALLQGLHGMMPRANPAEKEAAWRTLAAALEKLPVGTSQTMLEEARDMVVAGALERVEQRLGSERRQAEDKERQREAARRRSEAEFTVAMAITHVDDVLRELDREGEVEFDGFNDRWDTRKKMEETVGPLLVEELIREPDLTREAVRKRIRALVRKNLPAVVPD